MHEKSMVERSYSAQPMHEKVLTEKVVAADGKSPDEIEEIIIPGRGIARIEDFDRLTKLQHLNVSFNKLTKLYYA